MVGVRVFGAHSAGGVLWFACAGEDGFHDIGEDFRVAVPTALESGEALERTQEDLWFRGAEDPDRQNVGRHQ